MAVVAFGALAAMVAGIWLAYSSWARSSTTATQQLTEKGAHQLTENQLRLGDCLTGSNLGLGTGSEWPSTVTAVPCSQPHLAEIVFAGNLWPASATYPGDGMVSSMVEDRCLTALYAHVGPYRGQRFRYDYIAPGGGSDWSSGDRLVVCVGYEPGVTLRHSL